MVDGFGTTTYNYNPIGQVGGGKLKSVTSPVGNTSATANTTYGYDGNGQAVIMAVDGVAETYQYDHQHGQLTSVTNPLGTFQHTYDPNTGRLQQVVNGTTGQTTKYGYYPPTDPNGAVGKLKSITNMASGSATLSAFNYAYNHMGQATVWNQQLGAAVTNNYTLGYDDGNRLAGVTLVAGKNGFDNLPAGQGVAYTYSTAGNRLMEKAPVYQNSYGKNYLNQVTKVSPNPLTVDILSVNSGGAPLEVNGAPVTQGANGAVTASVVPSSGTTTTVQVVATAPNGATTLVTVNCLNSQPVNFDRNGNTSADNAYGYLSDGENRLAVINMPGGSPNGVADTVAMQYDGRERGWPWPP